MNPALKGLEVFVGEWDMELSNASFLPDPSTKVQGVVSFEWLESGDFMIMRQGSKVAGSPYASWIIGRDESLLDYTVLYFDDRSVSRIYEMSFNDGFWKLWRQSSGFSQRFDGKLGDDGNSIIAYWEKSLDGKTWEHDFDLKYKRRT